MRTEFENFEREIKVIENYFGKELSAEQAIIYHDACGHIPLMPLAELLKNIIRAHRPTPGNMPTPDDINAGWRQWQSANPTKMEQKERTSCDECGGDGFIWYTKDDYHTGQVYEHCARCALCENWKVEIHENVLPACTKKQLADLGYVVFERKKSDIKEPVGDVDQVVKKVAGNFLSPESDDSISF